MCIYENCETYQLNFQSFENRRSVFKIPLYRLLNHIFFTFKELQVNRQNQQQCKCFIIHFLDHTEWILLVTESFKHLCNAWTIAQKQIKKGSNFYYLIKKLRIIHKRIYFEKCQWGPMLFVLQCSSKYLILCFTEKN